MRLAGADFLYCICQRVLWITSLVLWLIFKDKCLLLGQEGPEIINSVTGKDDQGVASRLSKQGLFRRFLNLVGRISSRTGLAFGSCPRQYSDAKEAVQDYKVKPSGFFILLLFWSNWRGKNMQEEHTLTITVMVLLSSPVFQIQTIMRIRGCRVCKCDAMIL